jgi:tRNA A-37 threonylcarbamoyl transferase component Bud32
MASLVGKTLGKYRLVARLGRGGMAEVYKAYQPGLDRYVGIKVLHAHLVDDQDFINRFEREALAIGKLRHPNIVQAVDFDRDGETYFMAMEFIDGPTLKDEIKARKATNQPFTSEEISRIFTALCGAIDYAHSRGMVHRDIKPANVMINDEGQVVLTDFGIARIMGATQYTQTGALSGTPAYMSPEQGQGERGDERSDIYSIGVMLYEMLTGIVPYDADTPFAVIMKHISEPLPLPSKINPDVPEPVERVILKSMSKDPDDRYQTGGELARALRDAIGLSPDDNLRTTPLKTIASAPQVEQIEHETGPISTMKPHQATGGTFASGGETVMGDAGAGATRVAPPPAKKGLPMAAIIGGGFVIILLLIGVIGVLALPSILGPSVDVEATNTAVSLAAVEATETAAGKATQAAALTEVESAANEATATAETAAAANREATEIARQATDTARDVILATLASEKNETPELQVVTATSTETPTQAPPTETPTPAPATSTPTLAPPTNTPVPLPPSDTPTSAPPTDTPTPERPPISGKLALPVDNGRGSYDVIIVSIPNGNQLGKIEGARQPNFRPDGVKLLVNGEGGSFGENIFEASGTGSIERPVSGSPTDLFPFYKPDGTTLAYSNPQLAFGSEGYQTYLFVQCGVRPPAEEADKCAAIADFGIIVPSGGIGDVIGSHPVWTAGDLLAYKGCNTWAGGGSCGMFIVGSWATKRTSSGETPRKLADGSSVTPTDAKSGWIAYMSRESGDWEAFVMREDGSGVVNISNGPGTQDGVPTISPDGQWVAFASNRAGSWAVFVAPISGGEAQKLFDFPKGNPWLSGDKDWSNERLSWGP